MSGQLGFHTGWNVEMVEVSGLVLLGQRKRLGRQERRRAAPGPGQTKRTNFCSAGLKACVAASCPIAMLLPGSSGSPLLVFNKPEKGLDQQKCTKAQMVKKTSYPRQAQAHMHDEGNSSSVPGLKTTPPPPPPSTISVNSFLLPLGYEVFLPIRLKARHKRPLEAGKGESHSVKPTGIPRVIENQGAPPTPLSAINKGKCL